MNLQKKRELIESNGTKLFLSETRPSFKKEYGLDEEGSDFERMETMACFIQKKAKIRVEGSFFGFRKRETFKKNLNALF